MAEMFNFDHSEQYTLSIRLSTDGFSFSVYNPLLEQPFHICFYTVNPNLSMAANIKQMLQQYPTLCLPYKCVRIFTAFPNFQPIPFDLFDEDTVESIYYYCHKRKEGEQVCYNILPHTNIVMLYAIDEVVHNLLLEQYPQAKFYSTASPLTEHFAKKSLLGNTRKLYAYKQGDVMMVFAMEQGKALLVNHFLCNNTDECVYFLLNVWKQLGFNQQLDELHLVEQFPHKEEVMQILRKYIAQVFVIHPRAEFNRAEFTRSDDVPFDLQTSFLYDL